MVLKKYEVFYKVKLLKIIDGDTVDFYVNLGMGFFCNARIRLLGVDAPEIYKVSKDSEEYKLGKIAQLEVKKWFYNLEEIYIIRVEGRCLYGRWLAEVFKINDNESLNEYMKNKFYKTKYFKWEHQKPLKDNW